MTINEQKYIPYASVTISITIEDDGYTYTNYDIDVTLEEIKEEDTYENDESAEPSFDYDED